MQTKPSVIRKPKCHKKTDRHSAVTESRGANLGCNHSESMRMQDSELADPSSEVAFYIDQIEDYKKESKSLEVGNKQLVGEVEKLSLEVYEKDRNMEILQKKLLDMTRQYEEANAELANAKACSKDKSFTR